MARAVRITIAASSQIARSAVSTVPDSLQHDSSTHAEPCDVLVVGGGPAGSAAATLLARQGRRVVLLEKAHHPRFHIGESLLPANGPLFDDLGVREQVDAIAMPKWGVDFTSPHHTHHSFLEFSQAWDKTMPCAWQVRRSEFDEALFRNAGANGARTLEGVRVDSVQFDTDGASVRATLDDGAKREWRARYVIDASGRDTLLANQFGIKQKNRKHNSAALFGHFRGARRLEGKREGNISLFWFQHGWCWFIPLADGTTSVGAVCWPHYLKSRAKSLQEFFNDTIAMAPPLAERLRGAELIDNLVHATGNYSYSASRASGERYLMLGDAYAFIDPVFSSGVHLAMMSAFEGAKLAAACLDGAADVGVQRRRFEAHMRKGPREFSWFIFRMTNPAIRQLFMHPSNVLRMQEAVLSLLAGDIFGKAPLRHASLLAFKGVYYLSSLVMLPRAFAAWRARRVNIRDVGVV
jgi:flavin-dependent dehydrogenase